MKSIPAISVVIMIARGRVVFGSRVCSVIVDTESKPRNERHSTAAPATNGPNLPAPPFPVNGARRPTVRPWPIEPAASATETTMKIACTPMISMLARATETTPTMFSTVTMAIDASTKTHGGMAGKAAFR